MDAPELRPDARLLYSDQHVIGRFVLARDFHLPARGAELRGTLLDVTLTGRSLGASKLPSSFAIMSTHMSSAPGVPRRQYGWTSSSSWSQHTLRQLRFILPGGAAAYWLDLGEVLRRVLLESVEGWGRTTALAGVGLGLVTVVLFLYVLIAPWMTGSEMNVRGSLELDALSTDGLAVRFVAAGWDAVHGYTSAFLVSYVSSQPKHLAQLLTVSIAFGWSTLAATFCVWSDLGYTKGIIGGTYFRSFNALTSIFPTFLAFPCLSTSSTTVSDALPSNSSVHAALRLTRSPAIHEGEQVPA